MSRGRLSLIVLIALMSSALWLVKGAPIQALPIAGNGQAGPHGYVFGTPGMVAAWPPDLLAIRPRVAGGGTHEPRAVQVYDIDYEGSGQGTEAQVAAVVARIRYVGGSCHLLRRDGRMGELPPGRQTLPPRHSRPADFGLP